MSVNIPSGYADRHVDHYALVTFYLRDSLKSKIDPKSAFNNAAPAATSLHVYNAHTHDQWHAVSQGEITPEHVADLKETLALCGKGSMVVVAHSGTQAPGSDAHEENIAKALRHEGLIHAAEQFVIVKAAPETALQCGPYVSRLQLA